MLSDLGDPEVTLALPLSNLQDLIEARCCRDSGILLRQVGRGLDRQQPQASFPSVPPGQHRLAVQPGVTKLSTTRESEAYHRVRKAIINRHLSCRLKLGDTNRPTNWDVRTGGDTAPLIKMLEPALRLHCRSCLCRCQRGCRGRASRASIASQVLGANLRTCRLLF